MKEADLVDLGLGLIAKRRDLDVDEIGAEGLRVVDVHSAEGGDGCEEAAVVRPRGGLDGRRVLHVAEHVQLLRLGTQ